MITKLGGKPDNKSVTQLADVIKLAGQGDYNDKDKNKGLGLVKTANRAPNMQEASKNESWAASPNWVFNLITGNCEAELKKHIINAMRSGVESDPGVFCYRGTIKSEELNKTKTSGIYTVSYGTYSGALLVFNASGSVGIVQFLKPNWEAHTAWRYRNAIDGKLDRWNTWRSIATSEEVARHTNNKSNPHGVTKAQLGLGNVDNTADKDKGVKYAAVSRHSAMTNQLQAYTTDDFKGGNHFIKAIRNPKSWAMRLYACYADGKKQADSVQVNYANSAGKASTATVADSAKRAETLGGYKAGNGAGMLVPVVAFNAGKNAGYIKLGNGLIVQWGYSGRISNEIVTITFPVAFRNTSYALMGTKDAGNNTGNSDYDIRYYNKRPNSASWYSMRNYRFTWIAIGI